MGDGLNDATGRVETVAGLEALYGPVSAAAVAKVADHLTEPYRAFVAASPFAVLATQGAGGLDVTPRGDAPGFVAVEDARTLLLPDRRGNNRLDALRNIVADPRVGLLFLIPGIGETLRVVGRAAILADPALCARFAVDGKPPATVLRITVERVYFQCAKALARSDLWNPQARLARAALPSNGAMLAAASAARGGPAGDAPIDAAAYDAAQAGRPVPLY